MAEPILKTIAISKIVPSSFQPRESFDREGLEELADSMKNVNVLHLIFVRPHKGGYQIACGEPRWRAPQIAGWDEVPAVVKDMDDRTLQLCSIVENLHRHDLEAYEKEKAIYDLWKKHYEKGGLFELTFPAKVRILQKSQLDLIAFSIHLRQF